MFARARSACATHPTGVLLRAIRDDDQVAAVAGKPVIAFKVEAFAVSAAVLGLAGALCGHYTSYIAPEGFVPLISIYIVLALTAGGTGNNAARCWAPSWWCSSWSPRASSPAACPVSSPVQVAAVREFLIGASLIGGAARPALWAGPRANTRHSAPEAA